MRSLPDIMEAVYHIGAHCTDDGRFLTSLQKNRQRLGPHGIAVPGPGRYRDLLREMTLSLRGAPAPTEMQQTLLQSALGGEAAQRVIFDNPSFLSAPAKVLAENRLYPMAGEKSHWLAQVLPEAQTTFLLGLRNPASFIPALFAMSQEEDFAGFVAGVDPQSLRWSDMVARIRNANTEARLVVWADEDTPLIWPELLRLAADGPADIALEGGDDLLQDIMAPAGLDRMRAYLAANPPLDARHRRRIAAAFLDKYARDDAMEEELAVPGWTEELVGDLTRRYEDDLFEIERMPGVEFIAP